MSGCMCMIALPLVLMGFTGVFLSQAAEAPADRAAAARTTGPARMVRDRHLHHYGDGQPTADRRLQRRDGVGGCDLHR